jgi:membrane protein implicated in regulation of membrane protease activity
MCHTGLRNVICRLVLIHWSAVVEIGALCYFLCSIVSVVIYATACAKTYQRSSSVEQREREGERKRGEKAGAISLNQVKVRTGGNRLSIYRQLFLQVAPASQIGYVHMEDEIGRKS